LNIWLNTLNAKSPPGVKPACLSGKPMIMANFQLGGKALYVEGLADLRECVAGDCG